MTPSDEARRIPARAELFGFYYLGFDPAGNYKFPNVRHVAAFYGVSHDAVLRWLEELDLNSHKVLLQKFDLAKAQVDLQMDCTNLTLEGLRARIKEVLDALDGAESGRQPWID